MMWRVLAWIVSAEWVANWLIAKALPTPYLHIGDYMHRYWLVQKPWFSWLPQVRIHHIRLPDAGHALHNHPFDARTILLKGYYLEYTETGKEFRIPGETFEIRRDYFHRIVTVPSDATWTLFFMWHRSGDWGFKVGNVTVPHEEYLG